MLKQIIDEKEIIGKTIAGVKTNEDRQRFFINFTDETFCSYIAYYDNGDAQLVFMEWEYSLDAHADIYNLYQAGIITDIEFANYAAEIRKKEIEITRTNDIKLLKILIAKYPDVKPK